jgi:hypothetical protein
MIFSFAARSGDVSGKTPFDRIVLLGVGVFFGKWGDV